MGKNLKKVSEDAVLNANYLKEKLKIAAIKRGMNINEMIEEWIQNLDLYGGKDENN